MPFPILLNGLNAAYFGLRTTANNIANVGTTGFKESRAEFPSVQMTQGNVEFTNNALDVAIGGDGFFVLWSSGGARMVSGSRW